MKIVTDKEGKPIIVLGRGEKIETPKGTFEIKDIHIHEYSKDRPGVNKPTGLPTSGHLKATIKTPEGTKTVKVGDVIGKPLTEVIKEVRERVERKKSQEEK